MFSGSPAGCPAREAARLAWGAPGGPGAAGPEPRGGCGMEISVPAGSAQRASQVTFRGFGLEGIPVGPRRPGPAGRDPPPRSSGPRRTSDPPRCPPQPPGKWCRCLGFDRPGGAGVLPADPGPACARGRPRTLLPHQIPGMGR